MASDKDPIFELLHSTYKTNPNLFTNEDVDFIRGRASELGIDFKPESNDFNLARSVQQAVYGFVNGFTTLQVGEQPRNEVETIFHNVGHLAGFMGFIPGAGTLARVSALGFAKGFSRFLGREAAEIGASYLGKSIAKTYGNSLPMIGANWVMKGVESYAAKNAALNSIKFLKEGAVVRDILQGAGHLGVASAISAAPSLPVIQWDWALDQRLDALVGGIEAGAAFRVLGNVIKPSAVKGMGKKLGIEGEFLDDADKIQKTTNAMRVVAASAYMGIPSTLRGDPSLLQVYEYVAGGAFGYMEKSIHERQAGRFINKIGSEQKEVSLFNVFDPNPKIEGWESLTPEAQDIVRSVSESRIGRILKGTDEYLQSTGMDMYSEGGVIVAKGFEQGIERIKEDLRTGKLGKEEARKYAFGLDFAKRAAEYEANGVDESSAFDMAAQDVAKDYTRTAQIAKQLDAVQLRARAESDAVSVLDTIASNLTLQEINDVIRENDADARFINIFYDIAKNIQQKPVEGQDLVSEGAFRFRVIKDMLSMSAKTVKEGKDVDAFIGNMETLYGKLEEGNKNRLKQVWLNIYDTHVQPMLSVNKDSGAVTEVSETTADGNRAIQMRPFSFAEDILSGIFREDKRVTFINDSYEQNKAKDGTEYNTVRKLYDAIDVDIKEASALPGLLKHLASRGKMVLGGMKANDRLVVTDAMVKETGILRDPETGVGHIEYTVHNGPTFTIREKLDAANDVIRSRNDLARSEGREKDVIDDAYVAYEKEYAEYAKLFREHADKENNSISDKELRRMFDQNYANNIAFIEQINGDGNHPNAFMPWEVIIANPDRFIKSVQDLNKRNQIIFAGEHRAASKPFLGLPGVLDINGKALLNYVIIDTKDALYQTQEPITGLWMDKPITAYEMRKGVPSEVQKDTHLDGIFLVRGDVFNALMDYAGLDKSTGHQKGTLVHTEAGKGMIIGKFAYHRAAPELDKHMMENGIHIHAYDSAVKQRGMREKHGLRYRDGSGYYYKKAGESDNLNIYQIPAEALSINFSAGEHPESQTSNQRAVVQLYSNLNLTQAPQKVLDDMFNFVKEIGFRGSDEANNLFKAYEATMNAAKSLEAKGSLAESMEVMDAFDISKIKVEDMGLGETIKVLKDPYLSKTPLYEKVMRHILRLDREGKLRDDDGIVDEFTQELDNTMNQMRSGAIRAFEASTKITPYMVETHPTLSGYAQSVITSYIMGKAKRPIVPNSFKAIMTPYQLEHQGRAPLNAGEYMLDAGMRGVKIEFHTDAKTVEEMSLGKAWEIYNAVNSKPYSELTQKELALSELWVEDMRHAVIRVPADSMSGIRMLQFKGFTDVEGYGIMLHPEDMTNLGGADLDIDSAFIYTKLPKSVKEVYGSRESMYEWYKNYKFDHENNVFVRDEKGNYIESTPDDPYSVRVLAPSKENFREILAVEDANISGLKKHPMSMFNPAMTIRANQETYKANMILGPGLYHTRRMMSMYEMLNGGTASFRSSKTMTEFALRRIAQMTNQPGVDIESTLRISNISAKFKKSMDELRAATRDIVNFGADAEGRYINSDEIASLTLDKAFEKFNLDWQYTNPKTGKKVTGKLEFNAKDIMEAMGSKDPLFLAFGNAQYRYLQELDKLSKYYDYNLRRRMTLDDIAFGDPKNNRMPIGQLDHERFKPSSVWYRLAQDIAKSVRDNNTTRLSENTFGKEWTGVWSLTEGKIMPGMKADMMEWLYSKDPLAEMMRRFTFRDQTNIATHERHDPWSKSQDASDWATIGIMKEYGSKAIAAGFTYTELEKIAQLIDQFKIRNSQRSNIIKALNMAKSEEPGGADEYMSRDIQKSDLYKEVLGKFKEWYSKSPALGDFAAAWYTGSLYTQPQSLQSFMRTHRTKLANAKRRINEVTEEVDKIKLRDKVKALEAKEKEMVDNWYKTNFGALGLNSSFVPDYIIRDYFDTMNNVAAASFQKNVDPKEIHARTVRGASAAMQSVQPDAIAFDMTSRIPELTNAGEQKRFTKAFYAGVPHLAKLEMDSKYKKIVDDISDLLYKNPQLIPHFNEKLMGPLAEELDIIPTHPNIITIERLKQSVEALKRATTTDTQKRLQWYHWFLPPQYVAQRLTGYDPNEFLYKSVPTITGVNEAEAVTRDLPVRTFFSTMELMRRNANASEKLESRENDAYERMHKQNHWLFSALGKDARAIAEATTAIREEGRSRESAERHPYYGIQADEARKSLKKFEGKTWDVAHPTEGIKRMTLEDVMTEMRRASDMEAERMFKKWVYNEAVDTYATKVFAGRTDFTPEEKAVSRWVTFNKHGLVDVTQTLARFQAAMIEGTFYDIPYLGMNFLSRLVWQTEFMEKLLVEGPDGKMMRIRDLPVPDGINVDDYRSQQIVNVLKDPSRNKDGQLNFKSLKDKMIFFDEYHPHVDHSRKALKMAADLRMAAIRKAGYGEEVLQREEARVKNEMDALAAPDLRMTDDMESNYERQLVTPEMYEQAGLSFTPKNLMARSTEFGPIPTYDKTPMAWVSYNRSMSKAYFKGIEAWINHKRIEKFDKEKPFQQFNEAWSAYLKTYRRNSLGLPSLFPKEWLERKDFYIKNNAYYFFTDQAMWQFLSRAEQKMGKKFIPGDMEWEQYKEIIHNNGGLGKINTALNLATRDFHLMKEVSRINEFAKMYGKDKAEELIVVDPKAADKTKAQAYEYAEKRGIPLVYADRFGPDRKLIKKAPEIDYRALSDARRYSAMLMRFSVLEGKFNLISLLSHTKTMMANITTAATNTAIGAGFRNVYRAQDLKYINSVMPKIKSKDDLNQFRENAGALEGYIKETFGENVPFNENMKRFVQEGLDILKKNPEVNDMTLGDLARKYKLGQAVVDKAAWFMRTSEVIARGNSWMAHYLKGREILGANNYLFPTDNHPWLIRFANRGVEGTQFLYNNANKPAFARTSMGKVFFRFQQWAMSSILMRQEIARQAGLAGYQTGTPQYDKMQRLIVADMFMLGLATLFPATFFDSNLAPPLGTMVDFANFMYGDNKDRERAFFGTLPYPFSPLNTLMPPIGRIPTSVFSSMITGDWDRFIDYNLYTWFPFGRIGRDIKRTIDNPTMIIENMTNIPMHQMDRANRNARKPDLGANAMFHSFVAEAASDIFE